MQTQDEKISLINGRIHTQSGTVSNITFEHGRIVSVDDDAVSFDGKIIDLQGRTALPGFCDTCSDFLAWAESQERLSLAGVHSSHEMSELLSAYSRANPKPLREWYIAAGLPEEIIISRDDLDNVIQALPCAVIDARNSHAVLNTPAMNEFNMPQDNVELDEFTQHLPPLSEEDIIHLVKTYAPKASAMGITEIWGEFGHDAKRLWDIFFSDAYNLLTFRMRCNFGFDGLNSLNEFLAEGLRTGDGLPFCRLGGIIVSGNLEQQDQKNMIFSAHLSGCQVISDNSKSCLNALERVIKRSRKISRHVIRSVTSGLLERMQLLGLGGIVFAGQENGFIHEAFQNGLVISSGSGANLTSPVKVISDMVSHGLSVAEALSVYTWSASWNGKAENRRGGLSVGNDADIVILEQDPFLVRPEEIADIDVAMTFCAGRAVYDSGAI
ncbi:MAG: amidohydrolase family protein [Synergistaceae bacterium]|nr:amidohydrolase family protein [Synergistaceae bacterium]